MTNELKARKQPNSKDPDVLCRRQAWFDTLANIVPERLASIYGMALCVIGPSAAPSGRIDQVGLALWTGSARRRVAETVGKALEKTPVDATHWSLRSMPRATGHAPSTNHQIWPAFGLRPHRRETFKLCEP